MKIKINKNIYFDYKKRLIGKKAYPQLKNLSLDQDSANKRVFNHFSNYVPAHFYSVIRFEKWKKICLYVFQKQYNFLIPLHIYKVLLVDQF